MLCKQKAAAAAPVCRVLLTTGDGALVLVQQGRTKWTREEALADIVAVEMIDLQLSDAEGSIESELKNKDGKCAGDAGDAADNCTRSGGTSFTNISFSLYHPPPPISPPQTKSKPFNGV